MFSGEWGTFDPQRAVLDILCTLHSVLMVSTVPGFWVHKQRRWVCSCREKWQGRERGRERLFPRTENSACSSPPWTVVTRSLLSFLTLCLLLVLLPCCLWCLMLSTNCPSKELPRILFILALFPGVSTDITIICLFEYFSFTFIKRISAIQTLFRLSVSVLPTI